MLLKVNIVTAEVTGTAFATELEVGRITTENCNIRTGFVNCI